MLQLGARTDRHHGRVDQLYVENFGLAGTYMHLIIALSLKMSDVPLNIKTQFCLHEFD